MRKKMMLSVLCAVTMAVMTAVAFGGEDEGNTATVFEKSFAVQPGGVLRVDMDDVDVNVRAGDSDRAHVKIVIKGPKTEKGRDFFEKMRFHADVEDNVLMIEAKHERKWFGISWHDGRGFRIVATITIPERFDADVRCSDGDLTADGLDGELSLKTQDGDVDLGTLRGTSIRVKTSDGDVSATDLQAGTIQIRSSDGDLTAKRLHGGTIELMTSDGDVSVEHVQSKSIEIGTSDGDVTVDHVGSEIAEISSSDGDITVDMSGDELRARTSDGDINVEINGGSAMTLTTSDGDIALRAPSDLAADLYLRAESVEITGGAKITGSIKKNKVEGKLNSGGPMIHAKSSDGTISLRLR